MITITCAPCIYCGKSATVEVTPAEYSGLQGNALIHDALPTRDADFRELLITGTHPACWHSMFAEESE